MRRKSSKQTRNNEPFNLSPEYASKKYSANKERTLDDNMQNLQFEQDLQIHHILNKNKNVLAILAHDIKDWAGLVAGYFRLLKSGINNLNKNKIKGGIENELQSPEKSFLSPESILNRVTTENNIEAFQQEYVDIAPLVQKEIENIESFASQKQIKIYTKEIPNVVVFVDENKIKSVFRNILHNAIKNTYINGEIVVGIIKQADYVEISIKDNGIGIKEEIQKSLFTGKDTDLKPGKVKEPGYGFGLIFCKEIIDLHRGEIGVKSERGKGSEFKFTLPLGTL